LFGVCSEASAQNGSLPNKSRTVSEQNPKKALFIGQNQSKPVKSGQNQSKAVIWVGVNTILALLSLSNWNNNLNGYLTENHTTGNYFTVLQSSIVNSSY
jgi:hypothetical protein